MKEDPRDIIVPIRMNFEEKMKIKKRADRTGKQLSSFIRDSALRLWNKRKARQRILWHNHKTNGKIFKNNKWTRKVTLS